MPMIFLDTIIPPHGYWLSLAIMISILILINIIYWLSWAILSHHYSVHHGVYDWATRRDHSRVDLRCFPVAAEPWIYFLLMATPKDQGLGMRMGLIHWGGFINPDLPLKWNMLGMVVGGGNTSLLGQTRLNLPTDRWRSTSPGRYQLVWEESHWQLEPWMGGDDLTFA